MNTIKGRVEKSLLVCLLCVSMLLPMVQTNFMFVHASEATVFTTNADVYLRNKGNASKNYSSETLTSAHGPQYSDKTTKVLNVKNYLDGTTRIDSLINVDLPTKEELSNYDTFELVLDVVRNPNNQSGGQTYVFTYEAGKDTQENEIYWNNTNEERESTKVIHELVVPQNMNYETMDDADKKIIIDVSEAVTQLVNAEATSMSIYIKGKNASDQSLQFHSKESKDGSLGPKLVARNEGYDRAKLAELIAVCKNLLEEDYTQDSYAKLTAAIAEAEATHTLTNPTAQEIKGVYIALQNAKDNLKESTDSNNKDNVAFNKPTRSNLSKQLTELVVDGDTNTSWSGLFYPSYVDVDLMDEHAIEKIELFFPANKEIYYTIYGSNDGNDYTRLYQARNSEKTTVDAQTITFDTPQQYRIIRVHVEYTAKEDKAYLSEVKVYGTPQSVNTENLRDKTFQELTQLEAYDDTAYAAPIADEETIQNVYGIIERTIGAEYKSWFSFEIAANSVNDNDYYEISMRDGKVHIKGNEGLSLTTGLNYYYKEYLKIHISEQTKQVNTIPETLVEVQGTIRKETPYSIRYGFNYCTLSYTFAFLGEEDWQKENDWLALNGVNVVLDLAGQEATWILFLMEFGYSYDDAKDWVSGPSHAAWQYMQNLESFGGPLNDGYIVDRANHARESMRWKNSLGMQTVLQGYAGMVPTNFLEFMPEVESELTAQGTWNGFARPSMIATDSEYYIQLSEKFYEAQRYVLGETSDYYAVDPYHEGGKRPAGLTDQTVATKVLDSLLTYDPNGIWIIQGWQNNPTNGMLKGTESRKEHVLIVDLIKYPLQSWTKYDNLSYDGTTLESKEFNKTNWAWCLLGNFGGNPTMNGQLEVMTNDILKAQRESEYMVGIGLISEATYDNPIVYELLFDLVWADQSFDLDDWMDDYLERRYGGVSQNSQAAWEILKDSNYDHGVRYTNELYGGKYKAPKDYGKQSIPYGADQTETALRLLMEDFERFKDSPSYLYDLTELARQHVSNYSVLKYNEVLDAKNAKNISLFDETKDEFLNSFAVLNEVQSTQLEQLGGEWIGKAQDLAAPYDDFTHDAFEMGAKSLITSWGSYAGHRSLKGYGWRNYEGIFKDVHTKDWTDYLNNVEDNLKNGTALINKGRHEYFAEYWNWILGDQNYTRDAKDSPEEMQPILMRVLDETAISGEIDPNIGNIAMKGLSQVMGSQSDAGVEKINDGDTSTIFSAHAYSDAGKLVNGEVRLDLIGIFELSKVNIITPVTDSNSAYEVYSSVDGETWEKIGEKDASVVDEIKGNEITVENKMAKYIKVVSSNEVPFTISEIRVYGAQVLPSLQQIKDLVAFAETISLAGQNESVITAFTADLTSAKEAIGTQAPDEINAAYWTLYETVVDIEPITSNNVALNKTTNSYNNSAGSNDRNAVDDSLTSYWNAGRLSTPGVPYHEHVQPGWITIDLEKMTDIEQIKVQFGTNTWVKYTVSVSNDGTNWTQISQKESTDLPNTMQDVHNVTATGRYVKIELIDGAIDKNYNKPNGGRYDIRVTNITVMEKTEQTLNYTKLDEELAEAQLLDENSYTTATYALLQEQINNAKLVRENGKTQKEIDEASQLLEASILNLVIKTLADYSAVDAAITRANTYKKEHYTNYDVVQSAVDAVVRDKDITQQAQVNAYADAIEAAIDQLVLKDADYHALQTALEEAIAIDASLYNSFDAVQSAMDAVVYGLDITQQTTVDGYTADLVKAIESLTKKTILVDDPSFIVETASIKQGEIIRVKLMNGYIDDFMHVYVNGSRLTKDVDYTVQSGSIVVEINGTYTSQLSEGNATIQLVTTEMIYEGIVEINNTPSTGEEVKPTTPPTGDTSNYMMYLFLFMLSAMGIMLKATKK